MTDTTPAVGIDIGGTRLRATVVQPDGTIGDVLEVDTPVGLGTDPHTASTALLDTIARAVTRLDPDAALPVGIGFAGVITAAGVAVYGPNVSTRNMPVRAAVGDTTGNDDITVVNDGNAATWGEFVHGAGRAVDDMLMITLGTGVGGGIVAASTLLEGAHGFGGEVGHLTLQPDGWQCPCGNRGCLEAYSAGRSLVRHAADLLVGGRPSTLAGRELTPADVSAAAAEGDEVAIEAIRTAGRWLGAGIASLVNVLDSAVVVVGGGVMAHVGQWLLPAAADVVPGLLLGHPDRPTPSVVAAELGDRAGMVGAASLARTRAGQPS